MRYQVASCAARRSRTNTLADKPPPERESTSSKWGPIRMINALLSAEQRSPPIWIARCVALLHARCGLKSGAWHCCSHASYGHPFSFRRSWSERGSWSDCHKKACSRTSPMCLPHTRYTSRYVWFLVATQRPGKSNFKAFREELSRRRKGYAKYAERLANFWPKTGCLDREL